MRLDAKSWWLGLSVPTVVLSLTVGIVTGVVFLVVFAARGYEHWMMVRS